MTLVRWLDLLKGMQGDLSCATEREVLASLRLYSHSPWSLPEAQLAFLARFPLPMCRHDTCRPAARLRTLFLQTFRLIATQK